MSLSSLERDASARMTPLTLDGGRLTAAAVESVARGRGVALDEDALARVAENRAALDRIMVGERPIYGVTTGFGALMTTRVPLEQARAMQTSLLRSHAAGVGAPLPREVVRAALTVRINGLLRGVSGIRPLVLSHIATLLNRDIVPRVPRTGSLGASGDLAPSAHAALVLLGEGEAEAPDGRVLPGAEALELAELAPLELQPKEGLALINGTHFMAGIGALALRRSQRALDAADAIAALTIDVLGGATAAFDARVHALRPVPGQLTTAALLRATLAGSGRTRPPLDGPPQDAYALRCVPQVHGAAREAHAFAERLIAVDLEAVTDNPLIFDDDGGGTIEAISAGNFHGQSLALAFDTLRLGLADLASLAERRTFRLLAPTLNGTLPAFLTSDPGASSGYMIVQYTAAALLSELRVLAQPVSIDSVPTSDSQEDHVSMGMTGALLTLEALERLERVLACELLCAAQGAELSAGRLAPGTEAVRALVRERVPPLDADRPPSAEIEALAALVRSGRVQPVGGASDREEHT